MSTWVNRFRNSLFSRSDVWLIAGVVLMLIAVVTSYAQLCAYVNRTGARRWKEVNTMLQKDGEPVDFMKCLPPNVDRAANFCAIEPLDGIALQGDANSPQERKRMALNELGWTKQSKQPPSSGNWMCGKKIDFAAWAKFARDTGFIQMPADSGDAARDLLQAIDSSQPLVKQLADAAANHPQALLTPTLRDRPSQTLFAKLAWVTIKPVENACPWVHYNPVQNACRALGLRALVACGSGDSAAAVASVQAMLRIEDAFSHEPVLMGAAMAVASDNLAQQAAWSILEKRAATERELQVLEDTLETLHNDRGLLLAARGELGLAIELCDYAKSNPGEISRIWESMTGDELDLPPIPANFFGRLLFSGVMDFNKASIASLEYEGVIRPLKIGSYTGLLRGQGEIEASLKAYWGPLRPDCLIARLMLSPLSNFTYRVCCQEAIRRQAVIACALERYYLQHNAYPDTLDALVHGFISCVPTDPMDDKPMRYRQTADGRYMLWSVGFDQKDDDGKVNLGPGENPDTRRCFHRDYKGDWAWQYTPVKYTPVKQGKAQGRD